MMDAPKKYSVTAREDGPWWFVEIPELDTAGQAPTQGEVEDVAREIIGLWTGAAPETFDVVVSFEGGP